MNNKIFNTDLSILTLNNNCLIKTQNKNKNVVRIPYIINFSTSNSKNSYTIYPKRDSPSNDIKRETFNVDSLINSCNSIANCRGFNTDGWLKNKVNNKLKTWKGDIYIRNGTPTLGKSNFINTLNISNANSENTLIFSYIFIPTTQYYKFRVTTTNSNYTSNGLYNGPCRIYLNNFQTVILDSYIQNNETRYEVIKKGTYLICIDLPQTDVTNSKVTVPLSFEYMNQNIGTMHPDRALNTSWRSLNDLLITNCDTLLTKSNVWTIVNLFINSANEYCTKDNNIISKTCQDYYTNIPNYITQSLNEELLLSNKSIYPDPINGEYSNWSISDTNWEKNMKNLSKEYGTCGKNVQRIRTRTYYPPRYGGKENKQNPDISDSQNRDVNCHNDAYVKEEWEKRSCDAIIPSVIREAQFNSDIKILTSELNKYNKSTLISNLSIDNLNLSTCYADWNKKSVSSFTLVGGDEKLVPSKEVMYSNVCYMSNYKWTHSKTTNILTMQTDGNLVLSTSDGTVLWSTNTGGNNNARLCVLRTGKLIIYKSDGTELWSYDVNNTIFSVSDGMWYELTEFNTIKAMENKMTAIYGNSSNILCSNLYYTHNYTISSLNNIFTLQLKSDGNFYLYPSKDPSNILWQSKTEYIMKNKYSNNDLCNQWADSGECVNNKKFMLHDCAESCNNTFILQTDGDLVIYPLNKKSILWNSSTNNNNGAYCELTNYGLILIRSKSDNSIIKCLNLIDHKIVIKHNNLTKWTDRVFKKGWEGCFINRESMYPELVYTDNFEWKHEKFKLIMQRDGNLVVYDSNNNGIGGSETAGNSGASCWLETDGRLKIYKAISKTDEAKTLIKEIESEKYTNFSHLKFSNTGYCLFLNTSYQILNVSSTLNFNLNSEITALRKEIKEAAQNWYSKNYYNDSKDGIPNLKANIKSYLKDNHWNRSGNWMFCRKGGQFYTLHAESMPKSFLTLDNNQYKFNWKDNSYKTTHSGFRGWHIDRDHKFWHQVRIDLKNINGYDNQLDLTGTGSDTTDDNYHSSTDWKNWESDKKKIRKATELRNGIEKPNYLPGYVRISGNDSGQTNPQNNLSNVSIDTKFPAGGFLISSRCGTCTNVAFPIFIKIRNKDIYADDIWNNHPELIEDIIKNKMSTIYTTDGLFNTELINSRIRKLVDKLGHGYAWTNDPWKNSIVNTNSIRSAFTNKKILLSKKSNFLSKLNNTILYDTHGKNIENFINPICNLTNILKDPTCSGSEYNIYKQYLKEMDTYCDKNSLTPICTSYITQEIVSIENPTNVYKINEQNKIKHLIKQENLCAEKINYLNPRCITINSKKPEIIQKQIKELDKDSTIYKQLAAQYGEEINYQTCIIDTNILDKDKDMCKQLEINSATYGPRLKSKRLEVCKQDGNLFHKECIELNKKEQMPVIAKYCAKDSNLLQKECLDFNKQYKLTEIKEQCNNNKTNNCKQLCKEYGEDFNDICFWENNQIYFILVFIALIIIGGIIGFFKFKNRKVMYNQQGDSMYNQQGDSMYNQQGEPMYN